MCTHGWIYDDPHHSLLQHCDIASNLKQIKDGSTANNHYVELTTVIQDYRQLNE